MTKRDAIQFVRHVSANIAAEVVGHIQAGDFPPGWDGHQLRVWLADLHKDSAQMSQVRRDPRGRVAREYRQVWRTVPRRSWGTVTPRRGSGRTSRSTPRTSTGVRTSTSSTGD